MMGLCAGLSEAQQWLEIGQQSGQDGSFFGKKSLPSDIYLQMIGASVGAF